MAKLQSINGIPVGETASPPRFQVGDWVRTTTLHWTDGIKVPVGTVAQVTAVSSFGSDGCWIQPLVPIQGRRVKPLAPHVAVEHLELWEPRPGEPCQGEDHYGTHFEGSFRRWTDDIDVRCAELHTGYSVTRSSLRPLRTEPDERYEFGDWVRAREELTLDGKKIPIGTPGRVVSATGDYPMVEWLGFSRHHALEAGYLKRWEPEAWDLCQGEGDAGTRAGQFSYRYGEHKAVLVNETGQLIAVSRATLRPYELVVPKEGERFRVTELHPSARHLSIGDTYTQGEVLLAKPSQNEPGWLCMQKRYDSVWVSCCRVEIVAPAAASASVQAEPPALIVPNDGECFRVTELYPKRESTLSVGDTYVQGELLQADQSPSEPGWLRVRNISDGVWRAHCRVEIVAPATPRAPVLVVPKPGERFRVTELHPGPGYSSGLSIGLIFTQDENCHAYVSAARAWLCVKTGGPVSLCRVEIVRDALPPDAPVPAGERRAAVFGAEAEPRDPYQAHAERLAGLTGEDAKEYCMWQTAQAFEHMVRYKEGLIARRAPWDWEPPEDFEMCK